MISEKKVEKIEETLNEIKGECEEGTPILVEGVHDRLSLAALGIEGKIFQLNGRKKLLNFLESLSGYPRMIVLTDFDRTGEELAKFCSKHLKPLGVEPLLEPREKLKRLLRRDVKDIEGMVRFLQNQRILLRNRRL